jgi:hypothetical protein
MLVEKVLDEARRARQRLVDLEGDRALNPAASRDERAITAEDLLLAVASSEGTGSDVLHALGFKYRTPAATARTQ